MLISRKNHRRKCSRDLGDSGTHDLKVLIYGYLTERINDYKIEVRIHDLLNNAEKGKFSLYV